MKVSPAGLLNESAIGGLPGGGLLNETMRPYVPKSMSIEEKTPIIDKLVDATEEAYEEAWKAQKTHPKLNSGHEGIAVILEEFEELKAEVWKKEQDRDLAIMRQEAIQVAAMALRFAAELT